METFIVYIAKTGICLGIFLLIYSLFLRRTTFFRFNRLFLLSGFLLSLVIPSIKYTYDVAVLLPSTNAIDMTEPVSNTASPTTLGAWGILLGLYFIGILILIIKNIYGYAKLRSLIKNGIRHQDKGYKVIENINIKSPFTVLNYILVNTKQLSQTEKELILKHEITHVDQKHWVDLLFSECILLLQWFNPLAWIYVRLLKENHEFLADKTVIDSGISPALYQAVLINHEFGSPIFSFSNSFNYSNPLNRLAMIKKTKSAPWKRIVSLAIAPLFGLFFWVSAEPRYVFEQPLLPITESQEMNVIGSNFTFDNKDSIKNVEYYSKGKEPVIIINGKEAGYKALEKLDANEIDNINVVKGEKAAAYGDTGKEGIIFIYTKEYIKNNPNAKTLSGKIVKIAAVNTDSIHNKPIKTKSINTFDIHNKNELLYIIDGEIATASDLADLDTDNIDSISVLKDKSAIEAYGDTGKNGVIIINTKK